MSADVYSVAPHTGRAGWSCIPVQQPGPGVYLPRKLGIKRSGTDFMFMPLPDEWSSFSMAYQYGESHYQISVSRGDAILRR
jgi:cellobiose phosphorylase